MAKSGAILALACLTVLLGMTPVAQANGVYVPEIPQIPLQRAVIVHRDGIETLVVESAFDSNSPSVGWILPLPAEPSKLEVADSGLLASLSICLRPQIVHDLPSFPLLIGGLVVSGVVAGGVIFCKNTPQARWVRLKHLLLLLIAGMLIFLFLTPGLQTNGETAREAPGVSVTSTHRIGSYVASTLRADTAHALSEWLEDHSFSPLSESAKHIVHDYIAQQWCFLVARLRREADGIATPHPISATFPAARAIYPMRLTALADSTTRVELFVVAPRRAAAKGFECVAADAFESDKELSTHRYGCEPFYFGSDTGLTIGSPDVGKMMWPGCTVTKLVADLTPREMHRDIEIDLIDSRAHRQMVFSGQGVSRMALSILLMGGILVLTGATLACRFGRMARRWERRALLSVAAATGVAAALVLLTLPVVRVRRGSALDWVYTRGLGMHLRRLIEDASFGDRLHADMTSSELADLPNMLERDGYYYRNPVTGEPLRMERSPGNFSSRTVGRRVYLCLYDAEGREYRVELPRRDDPDPEDR